MRVRRLAAATCLAATVLAPGPATGQAAVATCDGRAATLVGTDRDDELTGTPGDDVIELLLTATSGSPRTPGPSPRGMQRFLSRQHVALDW